MPDARLQRMLLAASLLLAAPLAAYRPAEAAEPGRHALVIGNAAYAALPAVPACRGAAAGVAEALRGQGYEVTERIDAGRGTLDAALGLFARRGHEAADETAIVYFCGYATEFDGRLFLLPVTASLARDADALTQGVLARSAAEAAARGDPKAGGVLLDLFLRPGAQLGAASMQQVESRVVDAALAFVAIVGQPGSAPATPLAAALRAELPGGSNGLSSSTVAAIRQRLAGRPDALVLAASGPPAPPQPPPPSPASPSPAPSPATPPQPVPAQAAALPTPVPPVSSLPAEADRQPQPAVPGPSVPSLPAADPLPASSLGDESALIDEGQMSETDRRRIQAALATDGYYSGRLDGRFGPETRAAIRRFQALIGAIATGRLTEGQAHRLLESKR